MGRTRKEKIIEILKKNGSVMSREDFRRAVLLEIGASRRTIKAVNETLTAMKQAGLINFDKEKITLALEVEDEGFLELEG